MEATMLKKMIRFGLLAAVLLLALNASPAFAASPEPIHIEVLEYPSGTSAPPEPFTASGPAVDAGLVCAAGMVEDVALTYNDPVGSTQMIWALKRFDCGDGIFDVELVVRLDLTTHNTTARWRIVDGTGDYVGLKGRGSLVGTAADPGVSILDVYDGRVH
jgi:hypothetical protein